jgi:hypothetical protein
VGERNCERESERELLESHDLLYLLHEVIVKGTFVQNLRVCESESKRASGRRTVSVCSWPRLARLCESRRVLLYSRSLLRPTVVSLYSRSLFVKTYSTVGLF